MSIILSFFTFYLFVAVLGGLAYTSLRDKLDKAIVFGGIWAVWVILLVIWGFQFVPTPSSIPPPDPNPQTIFRLYLIIILAPNLLVLIGVICDTGIRARRGRDERAALL